MRLDSISSIFFSPRSNTPRPISGGTAVVTVFCIVSFVCSIVSCTELSVKVDEDSELDELLDVDDPRYT